MKSISDVGSPELIAELLILQRQGEFKKKVTPSVIKNTSINLDNNSVNFEFSTPLAEGVTRNTIAKAFFRNNYLLVIWISALSSVMDGDYGKTLRDIRDSFTPTD